MNFINAKVLVAGKGISGLGAKTALSKLGAFVSSYCDGENFVDDDYDLIVLSPSFEKSHFLYEYARARKIKIIGEYALGVMLNSKPLIAITGTNGKTTTVKMIEKILQDKNVAVCGNVGISFASVASKGDYDYAITEVSSFQLEQTHFIKPKIAVITNIAQDHLERHKTMEEYAKIKYSISAYQDNNDYLILPYEDELYGIEGLKTNAKVLYVSTKKQVNGAYEKDGWLCFCGERVMKKEDIMLEGRHNFMNALFALSVCKIIGTNNETINFGLKNFCLDSHRIEYVGSINGVSFYDDSKSTNVQSVIRAVESMKGSTCLILCGHDKGLCYNELFAILDEKVRVFVTGEITNSVIKSALTYNFSQIKACINLENAVTCAYLAAPDNVLLSPGASSYDCYNSYIERGKDFVRIVGELANAK